LKTENCTSCIVLAGFGDAPATPRCIGRVHVVADNHQHLVRASPNAARGGLGSPGSHRPNQTQRAGPGLFSKGSLQQASQAYSASGNRKGLGGQFQPLLHQRARNTLCIVLQGSRFHRRSSAIEQRKVATHRKELVVLERMLGGMIKETIVSVPEIAHCLQKEFAARLKYHKEAAWHQHRREVF